MPHTQRAIVIVLVGRNSVELRSNFLAKNMFLSNITPLIILPCILVSLLPIFCDSANVKLRAAFSTGSVTFSQTSNGVVITIDDQLLLNASYKLTIHNFPVRFNGPFNEICKTENVGDIFGQTPAFAESDYKTECFRNISECATGDLTGRFNQLSVNKTQVDKLLQLSGAHSIFGRSLVIHGENDTSIRCATIELDMSPMKSVVGVFRAISPGIAGTITLNQASMSPQSATIVDIDLMLVDARSEAMKGLSLAIYTAKENPDSEDMCGNIDKLFNPHGVTACDNRNHQTCPVGDLYAKNGPIDVILPGDGSSRRSFLDTNLPLSGENSVVGLYFVISGNGRPLICAKIQEYQQFVGEVVLSKDSNGFARLTQDSVYRPVMVNMSASLKVIVGDDFDSKCANRNSFLQNVSGSGQADGLTLYGSRSVLFRPVLVKNGAASDTCTIVQPQDMTYHLKAVANFTDDNPCTGAINFEQAVFNTSKAFAFISSIVVNLKNKDNSKTPNHNWHVHELAMSGNSLQERRVNVKGHYNPYKVYVEENNYETTCNAEFPFRCELGDMSNKLGMYNIGDGVKYFTETENYLATWHNILGRSIVVHGKNKAAGRIAVAAVLPQGEKYSQEEITCINNTKTRDESALQDTVSKALSVATWRVANIRSERVDKSPTCLKYTFTLIDDSTSKLHQAFSDIVNDSPGKLGDFEPACGTPPPKWKIDEGNVDEIVGVIFGVLALLVLIIVIVFWMRRKHIEEEQKAKLMTQDSNISTNPAVSLESVPSDSIKSPEVGIEIKPEKQHDALERKNNDKEYKVTTSL